jgi:hypothetical protein
MSHGLYKPLLVLKEPWVDIFMNFILDLSWSMKGLEFIFVVVYRFSKMTYSISCYKIDDAMNIADLLFREVVWLHSIPMSIVSNRDVKFLSNFWKVLWGKLGTKILFSTTCHPQTNSETKVVSMNLTQLLRAIIQ